MTIIPDENHNPEENGVAEKVREALWCEKQSNPALGIDTYQTGFRFIPVTPELEAWLELIEDPDQRTNLKRFIFHRTQIIYSKQTIQTETLSSFAPGILEYALNDIGEVNLERLLRELREIFMPKIKAFMKEKEN